MMPLVVATREQVAAYVASLGNWIAAHTGDPGADGTANQFSGSRVQTTWESGDAVDGIKIGSLVTLNVASGTYKYISVWSAQNGGVCLGYEIIPDQVFAAAGQLKVVPTYTQKVAA